MRASIIGFDQVEFAVLAERSNQALICTKPARHIENWMLCSNKGCSPDQCQNSSSGFHILEFFDTDF